MALRVTLALTSHSGPSQQPNALTPFKMTTPASKLLNTLIPGAVMMLRSPSGQAEGEIAYIDAIRMARSGLIEGVGSSSGRIRYLRRLNDAAIEEDVEDHCPSQQPRGTQGSIGAQVNIGAYRQTLAAGTVWALCLCRGAGV